MLAQEEARRLSAHEVRLCCTHALESSCTSRRGAGRGGAGAAGQTPTFLLTLPLSCRLAPSTSCWASSLRTAARAASWAPASRCVRRAGAAGGTLETRARRLLQAPSPSPLSPLPPPALPRAADRAGAVGGGRPCGAGAARGAQGPALQVRARAAALLHCLARRKLACSPHAPCCPPCLPRRLGSHPTPSSLLPPPLLKTAARPKRCLRARSWRAGA